MARIALLLCVVAQVARAAPLDVAAGPELALLMRDEAGGTRTALAAAGVRVAWQVSPAWGVDAAYALSGTEDGYRLRVTSLLHRITLRPQYVLQLPTVALIAAAGPSLGITHVELNDLGVLAIASNYTRLGASAGLAVSLLYLPYSVRAGFDVTWMSNRWDISMGLCVLLHFGGTR